jgi:hypothetical protein
MAFFGEISKWFNDVIQSRETVFLIAVLKSFKSDRAFNQNICKPLTSSIKFYTWDTFMHSSNLIHSGALAIGLVQAGGFFKAKMTCP